MARLSKNKKLIMYILNACMHKNSSTPLNNTALQHYLGTKHLDFRRENNSTSGILIQEIWYIVLISCDQTPCSSYMTSPLMVYQATYNIIIICGIWYRIAQNFDGGKFWHFWCFPGRPSKFNPSNCLKTV